MPKKKKTKAVTVDGIPIKPISPAEHRRLDRRIKKKYEKLRRRYPEVHGKKVDWISHWHEEGYLSFNVRFTDGKNFSILCSPTIVTNVVDFADIKTGDSVIIREYYRRRDDRPSRAGECDCDTKRFKNGTLDESEEKHPKAANAGKRRVAA